MTAIVEKINNRKRPQALALAVYDPAAAAQHAKQRTKLDTSTNTGALVPFMAPPRIYAAVPLAAVAPNRTEPSWIRTLLRVLRFRMDMEVCFIGEKAVTATDLDTQQNRFRLPNDGVRHLRGMLSNDELKDAELLHEKGPRPRPRKQSPIQGEQGGNMMKKNGKRHAGLPMVVVDISGGTKGLKLVQWESSRSTVIHGDGYLNFIRQCSFKQGEVVEIWAFKEKLFHFFGVDMCVDGPLHVVIAKKEQ